MKRSSNSSDAAPKRKRFGGGYVQRIRAEQAEAQLAHDVETGEDGD